MRILFMKKAYDFFTPLTRDDKVVDLLRINTDRGDAQVH